MKKEYFILFFVFVSFLMLYSVPLKSVIGQENSGLNGEMNASFVYEGQNTTGWKFVFNNGIVGLKVSDLDLNSEPLFRDINLTRFSGSTESCEYYSFSFNREAKTLNYELPLEGAGPVQTPEGVFCRYSIEPITNDLSKILSLGGRALDPSNVCPGLQQKALGSGELDCSQTQTCEVLIRAGEIENFGFGIARDVDGMTYVKENNNGTPITSGEVNSKAQEFINRCLQGEKAERRVLTIQSDSQTGGSNSYNPYDSSTNSATGGSFDDSDPYCYSSSGGQIGCGNSASSQEPNFNINSCGCEGIINPETQSDCASVSDEYSDPEMECVLVDYYTEEDLSGFSASRLDEIYGSSKNVVSEQTDPDSSIVSKGDTLNKKAKPQAKKKKCKKKAKKAVAKPPVTPNPCTDNGKCGCCMAFAEASGNNIADECMTAVLCSIKNRINKAVFPPKASNVCAVVSQKSPSGAIQYDPYRCAGNSAYANSKYCRCCKDQLNSVEIAEKNIICGSNPPACDCNGADTFNNAGLNSWASRNCVKVVVSCCSTFDFYKCS